MSNFLGAVHLAFANSPEATFAKCCTYSRYTRNICKKIVTPLRYLSAYTIKNKFPLRSRKLSPIDKSIFFLQIFLALLAYVHFLLYFRTSALVCQFPAHLSETNSLVATFAQCSPYYSPLAFFLNTALPTH